MAALNSQYFDEDYSSDEDFQPEPPADDWKKVGLFSLVGGI